MSLNSLHNALVGHAKNDWEIKMLYDGDCPLCMREVNMLRKRDKDQNKIGFVDISSPEYSARDNAGISYEEVQHFSLPFALMVSLLQITTSCRVCYLLLGAHSHSTQLSAIAQPNSASNQSSSYIAVLYCSFRHGV